MPREGLQDHRIWRITVQFILSHLKAKKRSLAAVKKDVQDGKMAHTDSSTKTGGPVSMPALTTTKQGKTCNISMESCIVLSAA